MALTDHHLEPFRDLATRRTVCVTGGVGFIGSHLVDALLSLGVNVRVIDDLSASEPSRIHEQITASRGRLTFAHASILDREALAESLEGVSAVFHMAAMGSVPRSID